MNKKEFLENKINEFERKIYEIKIQKLYFQFLKERKERELKELNEKPIIYDAYKNSTQAITERETEKNKLKKEIEDLEGFITNLKESIEREEEFIEILKKRGLE